MSKCRGVSLNIIFIIDILLFLILFYSLYTDLRYGKIYNFITMPAIGAGLVLNAFSNPGGHISGLLTSFAAAAGAFVFFIIPYKLGALGGGDVKLMMAIGALKGHIFLFYAVISIGLVSFVVSLFVFFMQLFKDRKFSGVMQILVSFYYRNIEVSGDELKPALKKNLKFGISIFFGTVIAFFYLLKR